MNAEKRHAQLVELSTNAFASHLIRRRGADRWLLQRQHEGRWESIYGAEVVALWGGQLYVGGDISYVIFAHHGGDAEERVRWMGRCDDFGYYVAQKATIGTGRELTRVFDAAVAHDEVHGWLDEERSRCGSYLTRLQNAVDAGLPSDDQRTLIDYLMSYVGFDFMYDHLGVGMVLAPRVYYAYAALQRLCDLLDAQQREAS